MAASLTCSSDTPIFQLRSLHKRRELGQHRLLDLETPLIRILEEDHNMKGEYLNQEIKHKSKLDLQADQEEDFIVETISSHKPKLKDKQTRSETI